MKELLEAFKALRHAPRALWLVIFAYTFDSTAYFGMIPLMKPFVQQATGIRPELASWWVSLFTAAVTIVMLFIGKPTEGRLGIRKSLILALALATFGRVLYCMTPFAGGRATLAISLLIVALAEGINQPVAYAGVKAYTSEKTGSMGFALLYTGLNFGAMIIGPISAKVRTTFDVAYNAKESVLSGFNAVNMVCTGINALTLIGFVFMMTKAAETAVVRGGLRDPAGPRANGGGQRSPFRDARFMFFVFAVLPARTLFAHQWLTMPEYVLRCYPQEVADRMEWLVVSLNPLIIFFGVPTITALTKRFNVLTMMIVGTLVSSTAPFLLVGGPVTSMLLAYFFVFSIGEAIWSARFLEYAAELAPDGQVAQYMGVAQLPWFVAKLTTGLYSGILLEHFVPKDAAKNSGPLWLVYGAIAVISPIALLSARRWLRAGMNLKPAAAE